MDLQETIRQLVLDKERLDRAIAQLEELQYIHGADEGTLVKKRRGRKSMSPQERREVSERMRKYWAKKRQENEDAIPAAGSHQPLPLKISAEPPIR